VLRKWVGELSGDPQHAFSGHGQMKPEQQEIDRLRSGARHPKKLSRVVARLRAVKTAHAIFGNAEGSGRQLIGG
jgi:transposase